MLIFRLKTGNVFACSTCLRRLDCIGPAGFDAAVRKRGSRYGKVSEMLRLACHQCESAILSRRLCSFAWSERLSTPTPYERALKDSTRFVFEFDPTGAPNSKKNSKPPPNIRLGKISARRLTQAFGLAATKCFDRSTWTIIG